VLITERRDSHASCVSQHGVSHRPPRSREPETFAGSCHASPCVDHVDGRESPGLASSSHLSPRPRVARRGGAHAPPKGVLAGLASTNDCGATPDRACSVRSRSSRSRPSVVWVAEHRGLPQLAPCRQKRPSRFVPELPNPNFPSAKPLEVRHGTERRCPRIRRRVAVVRRQDSREVPLHDTSCDLPPDQSMPVTLHQGWPEGSLRPRCARSLDEEGGEVWLCGSAAASGTSGR
jgi:hypothetical protein